MKIIVLGSGPAGLMAAQGALNAHLAVNVPTRVVVVSRKVKSPLYGAQYLHRPIPGFTPSFKKGVPIKYDLLGSADEYRRKVYGMLWDGSVSPEDLSEPHDGWDIRATYDALWDRWEDHIIDVELDPINLRRLVEQHQPNLVINTIPRVELCYRGHHFGAIEVWAAGDAPALGIRLPYNCADNTVLCNGEDSPSWYRMSRVYGHTTVEWPGMIHSVPVQTAARVRKPTSHDCDCWDDLPMVHAGRYGRWEKGVLSHTAFFDTFNMIKERISGETVQAKASMS